MELTTGGVRGLQVDRDAPGGLIEVGRRVRVLGRLRELRRIHQIDLQVLPARHHPPERLFQDDRRVHQFIRGGRNDQGVRTRLDRLGGLPHRVVGESQSLPLTRHRLEHQACTGAAKDAADTRLTADLLARLAGVEPGQQSVGASALNDAFSEICTSAERLLEQLAGLQLADDVGRHAADQPLGGIRVLGDLPPDWDRRVPVGVGDRAKGRAGPRSVLAPLGCLADGARQLGAHDGPDRALGGACDRGEGAERGLVLVRQFIHLAGESLDTLAGGLRGLASHPRSLLDDAGRLLGGLRGFGAEKRLGEFRFTGRDDLDRRSLEGRCRRVPAECGLFPGLAVVGPDAGEFLLRFRGLGDFCGLPAHLQDGGRHRLGHTWSDSAGQSASHAHQSRSEESWVREIGRQVGRLS